jgi:flagellar protein FliO/FliZ
MESLFGAEMPLAVRFFLAFLIVLGLIGAIAWALRRFGAGRFRDTARGRQPRLGVIDHASVDGRRRLILVRRDNVEHLLMIGGPTDIVVEPNIVRAVAAPRDVPGTRAPASIEALPRAIPVPENGGSWPLQPEPAPSLRSSPRLEPLPDELSARELSARPAQPIEPPAPPARPHRETLAALADELGSRPTPPRRSAFTRPQPAEPRLEAKAEPQVDMPVEPMSPPQAAPVIVPPPAPPAPAPAATPAAAAAEADQSLADMASRLEAALRKPSSPAEPRRPVPPRGPAQAAEPPVNPADTLPPLPSRAPRPEPKPAARPEAKPSQPGNQAGNQASNQGANPNGGQGNKGTLYDSLEQEMASLLGRPTKT